jgi:nitrogen fixation NifU-like protein|tara:strand:- start:663 stop:1127 length:465 start_codon:yes stop_codon:yes gene_type:complete
MDIKELYQEIVLDHGKNPRNKNKLKSFNKEAKGHNPLCGDKIHIFLKLDNDKKVEDISFEGEGCAISIASASIMTETIKGKEFNVAKKILENFLNMLKESSKLRINSLSEDENTTMMSLSGVKRFPMRVKCATLAWHTFMHAAEEKKGTANTEK